MEVLAFVTAAWAFVMAVSPLLQVRKMVVARSSSTVSLGYFALLSTGFALWVAYGVSKGNAVIVVPNTAALLVGLVTMAVARRFRVPGREQAKPAVGASPGASAPGP